MVPFSIDKNSLGRLLIPNHIEGKMEVGPLTNWGFDRGTTVGRAARRVTFACAMWQYWRSTENALAWEGALGVEQRWRMIAETSITADVASLSRAHARCS